MIVKNIFTILRSGDEETIEIRLNDEYIGCYSHDSDGWHGISRLEEQVKKIADLLDAKVEYGDLDEGDG